MSQRATPSTQLAFDLLYEDLEKQHGAPFEPFVKKAVACRDWRELHLGLLGLTLEQKYLALNDWANQVTFGGSSPKQRAVQVMNFITVLRQRGVLHVPCAVDPRRV